VSIIIPAYNVAGYIEMCIRSVLAQTFIDFEVIVVNDGSTDATGELLDEYARRDSRINVIHKENEGVSAARNTGIEAAGGEFFLFYDGDDFVEPYAVKELIETIRDKSADMLIYGYQRYREGVVTETCYPVFDEGLYENDSIIPELLSRFIGFSGEGINRWLKGDKGGLYVENPALWRCMVRADLIRKNMLTFDTGLKVGEDTIFISDLLSCVKRCYVMHKCFYYLVYRESSTIASYENDALAKLQGKLSLLTSRRKLTDRVLLRSGVDIKPYWQGTVVMSALELAFLFSKKNGVGMTFKERYRCYIDYAKDDRVAQIVRSYKLKGKPKIKLLPLLMLKRGWHLPLFICVSVLNMMNYKFDRG